MKKLVKKIMPQNLWKKLSMLKKRFLLPYRIDGRGERLHLNALSLPPFESMNKYQKSHIRRYEFAQKHVGPTDTCGDFACGTGYGTVMLANKCASALGADLDRRVIREIQSRYTDIKNVSFIRKNLLNLAFENTFDKIVSFETIEHFKEKDIPELFSVFNKTLKHGGLFIFSTPYKQERSDAALEAGFHLTLEIDEVKINQWLEKAGFSRADFYYQNYETHTISTSTEPKDFIIGVAKNIKGK